MKKFKTRRDFHEFTKSTRSIFQAICNALEIANRADHTEAKHANEGELGNKPEWANTIWFPLKEALSIALKDVYGVELHKLDINWCGNGSFWLDIKDALAQVLVEEGSEQ